MTAGQFDRRIELIEVQASPVTDEHGQPVVSEAVVARPWAQFIQQSAREFLSEGVTSTETLAVFRMRWRPGVTTDHIVHYAGRMWNIAEVRVIGRRACLELHCTART